MGLNSPGILRQVAACKLLQKSVWLKLCVVCKDHALCQPESNPVGHCHDQPARVQCIVYEIVEHLLHLLARGHLLIFGQPLAVLTSGCGVFSKSTGLETM